VRVGDVEWSASYVSATSGRGGLGEQAGAEGVGQAAALLAEGNFYACQYVGVEGMLFS